MYPDSSYRHSIRQFLTFVVYSCNAYKYVHYLTLYHFRECITNLGVLHLLINAYIDNGGIVGGEGAVKYHKKWT
jgi:hypothetical protein